MSNRVEQEQRGTANFPRVARSELRDPQTAAKPLKRCTTETIHTRKNKQATRKCDAMVDWLISPLLYLFAGETSGGRPHQCGWVCVLPTTSSFIRSRNAGSVRFVPGP